MQKLKEIAFEYTNIDAISKKQFDVHLQLYKGYIKKINYIWEILYEDGKRNEANSTYSKYRGLKLGEAYALNGAILHELYFSNLGSCSNINKNPHDPILTMINRDFGSYENWKKDFIACGKSARGWAVLAYNQRSKCLNNFMSDSHDKGGIWNAFPLLVMDVYEHAYYIDYHNRKTEYIEKFINDINWKVVNNRAKALE